MIKIGIIGGSQPEIKSFVVEAKDKYANQLAFHVFDLGENLDEGNLWTYYKKATPEEMALTAVKMAHRGELDILVKGVVSTHTLLKAVLNKKYSLKKVNILSHVAVVQLPTLDRKILLTDSAINITPTAGELIEITNHVINVAIQMGVKQPKVAVLSAAENFNSKMPSSVLAKKVTEYFNRNKKAIVYGPLSFDLALSKSAVKKKRFKGPVAGDADILVVPNIDVGNVLYKSLVLFGGAVMGGTIVGTTVPIVLTSRSDSTESKLMALDLAMDQIK